MLEEEQAITPLEQLAILSSLIPDFKRYFVPTNIISDLRLIIDDAKYIEIVETEKTSRPEAVELLMTAVLDKGKDGLSYFIAALKQSDKNWKRFLNPLENQHLENTRHPLGHGQEEVVKYFQFLLKCLQGDIIRGLSKGELSDILLYLKQDELVSEGDIEDIHKLSLRDGAFHLFTVMPQSSEDWPISFFSALQSVKPELLAKIDPCQESTMLTKEESHLMNAESCQQPRRKLGGNSDETLRKKPRISSDEELDEQALLAGSDSDMDQSGDDDDIDGELLQGMSDIDLSDDEKLDDGKEKTGPPPEMELYKFQYELAAPSLAGVNNIVCAPTGSGKTRVALYIVQQHLEMQLLTDAEPNSRKRKVVFLANKVPLVQQQFKIFEKFLSHRFKCVLASGETGNNDSLHLILEDYDILVMTPKILENNLCPDKIPSLTVFSLIVFDECHNTRKGEPYNSLMLKYLELKKKGEKDLPQIVGLTASIGVEKASTVDKAKSHIMELMANLDVKKITVVEKHKEELEKLIPKPDEKMVELLPRTTDDMRTSIMDNMEVIEKLLEREFRIRNGMDDAEIAVVYPVLKSRPSQRHSQKYGQWATQIRRKASSINIPDNCDQTVVDRRRQFIENVQRLAESLVVYNDALDVHDLTRPLDVLNYVKKLVEPRLAPSDFDPHKDSSGVEKQLLDLVADLERKTRKLVGSTSNPNLSLLQDEIISTLEERGWDESRVMIFVRTRATCHALCAWLNSSNVDSRLQKMKSSPFTGTAAPQDKEGMTQNEQESIVDKFRSGDVKLLVCTTIGQEGIDIPDCNLVIRYNHVGNEVATVQTRGRSRKIGGLSVLLAMPHIIRKEKVNRRLVEIMKQAIEKVKEECQKDVNNQVLKLQAQAMQKEEIKRIASEQKKKAKKKESKFMLECRRCRKVKVDGSRIRKIDGAHHVIIGMDLVQQQDVIIKPSKKAKNVDNVQFTGDVLCNKEQSLKPTILGTMMKSQDVEYMALKAESWVMLNDKGFVEKSGKWKWVDVGYEIPERTPNDVKVHLGLSDEEVEGEDEPEASGGGDN